jgi:hypothetical protein
LLLFCYRYYWSIKGKMCICGPVAEGAVPEQGKVDSLELGQAEVLPSP